jgi:DNA polymerase-3 subunit epsilon
VIGIEPHPATTLAERVVARLLAAGPQRASALCEEVFELAGAPVAVAERLTLALLGADPRVRQLPDGRWGLVAEAQGSPLLEDCAFAVVDVETTGMRAGGGDRITEIAVAVLHGGRREVVFDSLVNPERPIPPMISGVTGITNAMVKDAPRFADIADQVLAALGGRVFVAHNARFDWSFVGAELRRTRDLVLDGPKLCTVRLARRLVTNVQSCGLDNLTRHFGFENQARHRAAGDALVTAQLLARLLGLARDGGARTLQDLTSLESRSTGRGRGRRRRSAMPSEPQANSTPESG